MDINDLIQLGRIDDSFALPPDQPFTYADAIANGVRRQHLTRLCEAGLLRRPVKGVYLGTHLGDSLALRADCLRLVVPEDCVVVDRHAGWLLGAEMVLRPNEHLELRPLSVFRPSGHGRLRNDISASGERNLRPDEIIEVGGMQVTTPLRTAWDLGRVRWTDEAIAGLDAMFRLRAFSRDEFLDGIERFRRMRWVTTLRAIGPRADGRSESPPESVLRLRCEEARLPVEPQHEVWFDGQLLARLDLANRELLTGVEYDGAEWHSSPAQLERDRRRRRAVEELGWTIHVFTAADVFGRQRECLAVLTEAARQARIMRGLRSASSE